MRFVLGAVVGCLLAAALAIAQPYIAPPRILKDIAIQPDGSRLVVTWTQDDLHVQLGRQSEADLPPTFRNIYGIKDGRIVYVGQEKAIIRKGNCDCTPDTTYWRYDGIESLKTPNVWRSSQ